MLNKTTGCDSRTVPPLYAQSSFLLAKASHWKSPGRQKGSQKHPLPMRESEDLRFGFSPTPARLWGSESSRKHGRGTENGAAAILFLEELIMKDRKQLALLCAGLAIFAACITLFAGIWILNQPDSTAGEKTFTLTVIHGDGSEKVFTITSTQEFLADALLDEELIVESNSPGMYTTVDGETADYSVDQSYWAFYVGDEYAMAGMNDTPIVQDGEYKLAYTVYVEEE
jgi:hypothetical protein